MWTVQQGKKLLEASMAILYKLKNIKVVFFSFLYFYLI